MMNKEYEVFKNGDYKMEPLIVNNKKITNARLVLLTEEDNLKTLGCGIFEMGKSKFEFTCPFDEAIIILEGEQNFTIGKKLLNLKKGDICVVKKGLKVIVETKIYVKTFWVNYPIHLIKGNN